MLSISKCRHLGIKLPTTLMPDFNVLATNSQDFLLFSARLLYAKNVTFGNPFRKYFLSANHQESAEWKVLSAE